MNSPISLAVFATSKGHHNHTDIYKSTINDLDNRLGNNFFASKVVHIKTELGHEQVTAEMLDFFKSQGFKVLTTPGKWKHFDVSHFSEHAKDIQTLMMDNDVQKNQYTFWLEDDFLLRSIDEDECKLLKESVDFLGLNPNIMNVRWLKGESDFEGLMPTGNVYGNIFTHMDVFSFNPCLVRSRDMWVLARLFQQHFDANRGPQIERFATEALRTIPSHSVKNEIFSAFKINIAKSVHIGTQEFHPGIEKTIKF